MIIRGTFGNFWGEFKDDYYSVYGWFTVLNITGNFNMILLMILLCTCRNWTLDLQSKYSTSNANLTTILWVYFLVSAQILIIGTFVDENHRLIGWLAKITQKMNEIH